jgi:hypothetical protein
MPPSMTTPVAPRTRLALLISSPQMPLWRSPAAATTTTQPSYICVKTPKSASLAFGGISLRSRMSGPASTV